ncbi:MAG: hypothetical protein JWQ22_2332, partial [Devosia sp.]|nr:hypothetical protein [Devosia sp.]
MYRGMSKDYQRLRSLIIQTRFPGFTAEVETAFWRVIDQENIYPHQPHFELAFKRHLKDDVELTDKENVH